MAYFRNIHNSGNMPAEVPAFDLEKGECGIHFKTGKRLNAGQSLAHIEDANKHIIDMVLSGQLEGGPANA